MVTEKSESDDEINECEYIDLANEIQKFTASGSTII